jgi:glutamate racemase
MSARNPSTGACIGVFDSGIGGLTVVRALRAQLPHERIVYLGDTARVPYGTRSAEVVRRYAMGCATFLQDHGAKLIVVACNTATAHALEHLQAEVTVPVVGVIAPGAARAAAITRSGRIGVICTEGTANSGSYARALAAVAPQAEVITVACPLLVPLAEEGWTDHAATRLIAEAYLAPLLQARIDTLVLGCTHYPILAPLLAAVAGADVTLVDSAMAVAETVAAALKAHGLAAAARDMPDTFFATDVTSRLQRVGSTFLQAELPPVHWVDLVLR